MEENELREKIKSSNNNTFILNCKKYHLCEYCDVLFTNKSFEFKYRWFCHKNNIPYGSYNYMCCSDCNYSMHNTYILK